VSQCHYIFYQQITNCNNPIIKEQRTKYQLHIYSFTVQQKCVRQLKAFVDETRDVKMFKLEMWANAQPDGRPAEYRWRPLFNAAKFG